MDEIEETAKAASDALVAAACRVLRHDTEGAWTRVQRACELLDVLRVLLEKDEEGLPSVS